MDVFKANLIGLLDKVNVIENQSNDESEEHLKNNIRDFLRDTYYKDSNAINTKDKKDLVIHLGKTTDSEVGVLIEAKRPANLNEMVSAENPNKKAFHEIILYYLDERNKGGNSQLKQLVITNINEWYIIDANHFDTFIYRNTKIQKLYETKINDHKDNPFFYEEVAKIIGKLDIEIPCTYFDIRVYEPILRNGNKEDDIELSGLLKIFSPQYLLKEFSPNDSNSLNDRFYKELLHIVGLEEVKEGSKYIIRRKRVNRNVGSLIELTIDAIETEDTLRRLKDESIYGDTKADRTFNVALELCLTWINRVLFLKLLEGQLVTYHRGDKGLCFLNTATIRDFDELFKLFHKVLAVNLNDRTDTVKTKYSKVPYLNSSLFEISQLEDKVIKINSLDNDGQLELINSTILKEERKRTDKLPTLRYLFEFLDAYDFASEGSDAIQEENKTIINASVLGKVFEKINGYKDGSIFTPGFITMYMCKQSIRLAVVWKFNDYCQKNGLQDIRLATIEDVYDLIGRKISRPIANDIVNSLKICDPAVGSGHFLVSALNEMIAIKSELGVLMDKTGKTLRDYKAEVINDELYVYDFETGEQVKYIVPDQKNFDPDYGQGGGLRQREIRSGSEKQRVFETLFYEKQMIIENCLFGVDINPNSVKICQLRLWIELLKNAYYRTDVPGLETLPNIDINIKCGNSLVNRFPLDANLSSALKSIKYDFKAYRGFVNDYKNEKNREVKHGLMSIIRAIKSDLNFESNREHPIRKKLNKMQSEFNNLIAPQIFEDQEVDYGNSNYNKDKKERAAFLNVEINKLTKILFDIENGLAYKNASEWRFEFPEVLNNNGDFEGFDVVIGNPPYFSLSTIKAQSGYFQNAGYVTYSKGSDIYCLFYERGNQLLKPNGFLTYITSNSWLRSIYGDLLKKFFTQNMQPLSLLNIEDIQVFAEATVESSIMMLQKAKNNTPFFVANPTKDYVIGTSLSDYFKRNRFEYRIPETSEWVIGNEITGILKSKIERNSKLLKDFNVLINRGLLTGYNVAFIIDEDIKNKLINENPKSAEIIKPILRGRDLKMYSFEFSNQWCICTFPSLNLNIEDYPAILNHFMHFGKSRLEQLGHTDSRKKTRNKWFETQDAISYWEDFEKPKIIWGEISDKPKFAYDDGNFYAEATTFIMTGEKLKFLLGILNSKVSEWYFNQIGTTTGMGTNRWKKYKIEMLPIKVPSESIQLQIETLVDRIILLKKDNPTYDTRSIEMEIDQLVYQLYELTSDEIMIIEGAIQ